MEIEGRDFINAPPLKIVRFGGSVAETLVKYKQGDFSDYELLKHQLADPEIKDAQILNWLQEFRSCVTLLSKEHEQLIYCILQLPWVGRSQAVVEEYMAFLSNLVSAQTVYLCFCLRMVVSHFTPKRVTICEGGVDISDSDDENENLPRNFEQCHQALQLIFRYVPSSVSDANPSGEFPLYSEIFQNFGMLRSQPPQTHSLYSVYSKRCC